MIAEQALIDISYFIVHNIFQVMSIYIIMMLMITPKYNKAATLIILTAINVICEYILSSVPLPVYFACFLALLYVPALLMFREKKKICFFATSIIFLGSLAIDMIFSAITLSTYGYYPAKTLPYRWEAVYTSVLLDILYYCMFMPIVIIWRKKIKKYSVKSMTLFMLFPIGQALFLSACTYPTWAMGADFNVFDNPFMLIAVIVSAVSDILMFIALRDNNSLEIARARAEQAEKEMELQLQYYSELTEKMTEIREYRHDINNLVSAAEALITEESSQVSKDFIGEMKQKAENMKIPVYTGNDIANTVLWKKEQEAKREGIDFKVSANINESFPIDKIDICSLLANLLDNAIREAKETEEKTAEITVVRKFGLLMIEVVNSADKGLKAAGKSGIKSSKEGDHGHGLEIVDKIAEKYDGKFVFKVTEGKARAAVSLTIRQ